MSANYRANLTGLLGCPVDENPTGAVMEAAYRALGLNFRYITMLVKPEGLQDAVAGLRAMHYRGVNLTIPHKVAVLPYLDSLTEAARIIGAVNNITVTDGHLRGENTDGKGMLRSLRQHGQDPKGKHLTILVAGGAARAFAVECALAGAIRITLINRRDNLAAWCGRTPAACVPAWSPGCIQMPNCWSTPPHRPVPDGAIPDDQYQLCARRGRSDISSAIWTAFLPAPQGSPYQRPEHAGQPAAVFTCGPAAPED